MAHGMGRRLITLVIPKEEGKINRLLKSLLHSVENRGQKGGPQSDHELSTTEKKTDQAMIGATAIQNAGAGACNALIISCCMFNACIKPSPGISSYQTVPSKNSILLAHFANQLTINAISSGSSYRSIALMGQWRGETVVMFI